MPGRKPKPRHLRMVQGNPGKRPLPDPAPEPPAGKITRPKYLKYREIELWNQYAPALIAMETLTVVDVPNFAAWCVLMAKFEEAKSLMKAADVAQMRMLGASLGMDASSRTKIGAGGKRKPKDPADAFFQTG